MQPGPLDVPTEVAIQAPVLYIIASALVLLVGSMIWQGWAQSKANRARDAATLDINKQWMTHMKENREAAKAVADSCHEQQSKATEVTNRVQERMGENGVIMQQNTEALTLTTAVLRRLHGGLDKNGFTRLESKEEESS